MIHYLFFLAFIGFINFCFPNSPFYKSWLFNRYLTWSEMSHIYDFIVTKSNDYNYNEMMDKLYCYLHQIFMMIDIKPWSNTHKSNAFIHSL